MQYEFIVAQICYLIFQPLCWHKNNFQQFRRFCIFFDSLSCYLGFKPEKLELFTWQITRMTATFQRNVEITTWHELTTRLLSHCYFKLPCDK